MKHVNEVALFAKTPHPILAPREDLAWASGAVFNPGAWREPPTPDDEHPRIHLLFRAVAAGYKRIKLDVPEEAGFDEGFDDSYVSYIGYASGTDGVHFEWADEPFIRPDTDLDRFGVEDPRISKLDDRYLVTYTALAHPAFGKVDGVRIGLASTTDFQSVTKHGIVGPALRDKDAVIFPQRIGGRIAMLHRVVPNIQIAYFDDLEQLCNPTPEYWERHLADLASHVILAPAAEWESNKIGAGPTPIETDQGWLIIYHGVDKDMVYRAGLALLDRDDPGRVIARCPSPVLEPELEFERLGDVNNVVFAEGAVIIDGVLHLYYGAADTVVGHATAPLDDILDELRNHRL